MGRANGVARRAVWVAMATALALVLAPPRLQGGDLSVQLGLALARAAPERMQGDLLLLAAPGRPGGAWWAHLPTMWVSAEQTGVWLLALHIGTVALALHALQGLRPLPARAGAILLILAAWPQPIGAAQLLFDPQPVHRAIAAPALWAGIGAALHGKPWRAGIFLGCGLWLHPSTGWVAGVAGVAAAGPRALPGLVVGLLLVLRDRAGLPMWWALTRDESDLLRLRLGHHLDPLTWPTGPLLLTLGHLVLLRRWTRAAGRRWRRAALALTGATALGVMAPWTGLGIALQLHGMYAELWVVGMSLPWAAEAVARLRAPVGALALVLLLAGPWALAGRPWPPTTAALPTRSAGALHPEDDPWPRVAERRAAAFTLKDGGEIITGPTFLHAWAEGLARACGPGARAPLRAGEDWRGTVRVRRRCEAERSKAVRSQATPAPAP